VYGSGPHQHCSVLLDNRPIGQRTLQTIWVSPFLVRMRTAHRKDFEVILTVKMETRHVVREPFGRAFSEFVIIAEFWRLEVARPGNFLSNFCVFFLEKRSLSNCRYCEDHAPNLPGPAPTFGSHCSRFHPNRFTFGGVIAEHVKTVFAVEYLQCGLVEPIKMPGSPSRLTDLHKIWQGIGVADIITRDKQFGWRVLIL